LLAIAIAHTTGSQTKLISASNSQEGVNSLPPTPGSNSNSSPPPPATTSTVGQNHSITWTIPVSPNHITVNAGDSVIFNWQGMHDVVLLPNSGAFSSCLVSQAKTLIPVASGANANSKVANGAHCKAGMKLWVTVQGAKGRKLVGDNSTTSNSTGTNAGVSPSPARWPEASPPVDANQHTGDQVLTKTLRPTSFPGEQTQLQPGLHDGFDKASTSPHGGRGTGPSSNDENDPAVQQSGAVLCSSSLMAALWLFF